jgi:hypothetical protein
MNFSQAKPKTILIIKPLWDVNSKYSILITQQSNPENKKPLKKKSLLPMLKHSDTYPPIHNNPSTHPHPYSTSPI